jgi:hypothetical protein
MSLRALTLAIATLTTSWALAERPPVSLGVGYASQVVTHRAYDLVDADDHLPMLSLAAGYRFAVDPGLVDLDLTFRAGGTGSTAHQVLNAGFAMSGLQAGGTFRYPWKRHLEPYARLGLGYDWGWLTVQGVRDMAGAVSAEGLLGLQVPLRPRGVLLSAVVLDVGVGYALRTPFHFGELSPPPPQRPAQEPIEVVGTDIGRLPTSGIAYRLGLTFRL